MARFHDPNFWIDVGENGSGITDSLANVAKEANAEGFDNEVGRRVGV